MHFNYSSSSVFSLSNDEIKEDSPLKTHSTKGEKLSARQ